MEKLITMKKLFFVAAAAFVLASCGDGSTNVDSMKDSLVNKVDQKMDTLQEQVKSTVDSVSGAVGAKVDSLKLNVKSTVDSLKK